MRTSVGRQSGWLTLAKQDLEAGGHCVAGVVRLNNRKQEPSLAIKISLEATELPSEVPHRSRCRLLPHL